MPPAGIQFQLHSFPGIDNQEHAEAIRNDNPKDALQNKQDQPRQTVATIHTKKDNRRDSGKQRVDPAAGLFDHEVCSRRPDGDAGHNVANANGVQAHAGQAGRRLLQAHNQIEVQVQRQRHDEQQKQKRPLQFLSDRLAAKQPDQRPQSADQSHDTHPVAAGDRRGGIQPQRNCSIQQHARGKPGGLPDRVCQSTPGKPREAQQDEREELVVFSPPQPTTQAQDKLGMQQQHGCEGQPACAGLRKTNLKTVRCAHDAPLCTKKNAGLSHPSPASDCLVSAEADSSFTHAFRRRRTKPSPNSPVRPRSPADAGSGIVWMPPAVPLVLLRKS